MNLPWKSACSKVNEEIIFFMCWLIWKYGIYVSISIPWQINVYRETGKGHSKHPDEGWKHLVNTTLCIISWFSQKCHISVTRTVCMCADTMWTCHCNEAANEAEVGEVVWVDGWGRVDLQAVVALAGILKQTVHGVQHFMGQQEEPLSAKRGETEAGGKITDC